MSMIWRLTLLLLIFGTNPAHSEVAVTSGEHATFSRLVFPASDDVTYKLLSGKREITVTLDGFEDTFNLSKVFDRIPKTRIRAVEQVSERSASKLIIKLACTCLGLAYRLNQYLVIDVIDKEDSRFAVLSDEIQTPKLNLGENDNSEKPKPRKRKDPKPKTNNRTFSTASDAMHDPRLNGTRTAIAKYPKVTPNEKSELERAKNSLIRQLETAAEQGLVDFADDLERPETDDNRQNPLRDSILKELAKNQPQEILDSIRIKKPKETENQAEILEAEDTPAEKNCFPSTRLDPENWAEDRSFNDQLSELRSSLLGEFDQPKPTALENLIKFYLFFGLTIEANQLLDSFEINFSERKLLTQIANILGGKSISKPDFFGDTDCGGRAGLWSALSGSPLSIDGSFAEESILSAYGELPSPLKDIIANRLIDQLIDNDKIELAEKILAINKRKPSSINHEVKFLEARIYARSGERSKANTIYKELIADNSDNYQKAIIELAKDFVEKRSFPTGFIQDLENASLQNRDNEDGKDLFRLLTISETLNGSPEIAFGRLSSSGMSILKSNEDLQSLVRENFSNLIKTEVNSSIFASTVMQNFKLLDESDASTSLKIEIVDKLIETGLPNVALDLIKRLPRSEKTRMSTARALLMHGLTDEALSEIASIDTAESRAIRASIKVRQGDILGAYQGLNQTDAPILYEQLNSLFSKNENNNLTGNSELEEPEKKRSSFPRTLKQINGILQNSQEVRLNAKKIVH